MSEENQEIHVYQTRTFEKVLNKLDDSVRDLVDEHIELITYNPDIKKGDLSHVRVHKFKINDEQTLLGYNWSEGKVTLALLVQILVLD